MEDQDTLKRADGAEQPNESGAAMTEDAGKEGTPGHPSDGATDHEVTPAGAEDQPPAEHTEQTTMPTAKTTDKDTKDTKDTKAKTTGKIKLIRDDNRTTVIAHGEHCAATFINDYNEESGNPVLVFSSGFASAEERRHYFEGRGHEHKDGPIAGMVEIVNGQRVPVKIVQEEEVDHATLDGVKTTLVEIAPKTHKVFPHPIHHLTIAGERDGLAHVVATPPPPAEDGEE